MARPLHEQLHDKDEIRALLCRNPGLNLYALGDLDPAFWPWTGWFGLRRGGVLREVVLLYSRLRTPVVMAFAQEDPEAVAALLADLVPLLPHRFHAHLDLRCSEAASQLWHIVPYGHMIRMVLGAPVAGPPPPAAVQVLGQAQVSEVGAFLGRAYPGNFFEPRMMDSGSYLGWREGGALVAVAGVHVHSTSLQAAALGNVAVHPDRRGQGLGARLTLALCQRLHDQGIRHLGLNVKAENAAAIALYRKLGFAPVTGYLEALATVPIMEESP